MQPGVILTIVFGVFLYCLAAGRLAWELDKDIRQYFNLRDGFIVCVHPVVLLVLGLFWPVFFLCFLVVAACQIVGGAASWLAAWTARFVGAETCCGIALRSKGSVVGEKDVEMCRDDSKSLGTYSLSSEKN